MSGPMTDIPIEFRNQCAVCGQIIDSRESDKITIHNFFNKKSKKYECCQRLDMSNQSQLSLRASVNKSVRKKT